jgi:hypothetical protein
MWLIFAGTASMLWGMSYALSELNTGTAIGGLIIFCGVAVVYWFSR